MSPRLEAFRKKYLRVKIAKIAKTPAAGNFGNFGPFGIEIDFPKEGSDGGTPEPAIKGVEETVILDFAGLDRAAEEERDAVADLIRRAALAFTDDARADPAEVWLHGGPLP